MENLCFIVFLQIKVPEQTPAYLFRSIRLRWP
jgi:hypothetical protein